MRDSLGRRRVSARMVHPGADKKQASCSEPGEFRWRADAAILSNGSEFAELLIQEVQAASEGGSAIRLPAEF